MRFPGTVWFALAVGCAASSLSAGRIEPPPEPTRSTEAPAPARSATLEAAFPEGVDQVVHRSGEIEWGPCPPGPLAGLGCRMAVLEGSPKGEQLFTFRIQTEKPFVLPPHTHPRNERVTVIEGALNVGFGNTVDKARSTRFEVGDYYVNRAGARHFVWSDEPVTIQLTGIGPWAIRPADGDEAATN